MMIPRLPSLLPFGPIFPKRDINITSRNFRPVPMFGWYLLSLLMHKKLEETEEEWVIWIEEKMEQVKRHESTINWYEICIYRVPHYLKENDRKSYLPQIVSLGPYHHGHKDLLPMEYHKWRAVNMIMARTRHCIKTYTDAMKELETKARACYEGTISLSSNKFTQMLVLDGCFILEILRGAHEGFAKLWYDRNDPVFAPRGLMHLIQRDMVKLENQLPFFVLNQLLELQLDPPNQIGLVAQLAIQFFSPLLPTEELLTKTNQSKYESAVKNDIFFNPLVDKERNDLHCLDVFRQSFIRPNLLPEPRLSRKHFMRVADKRQQQLIHCVTELREAGIKFKKRKTNQFWDIRFKNGYLEIPKLLIHDGTKSLFSNLIAYEQCHINLALNNNITSYLIFMDNLIDSAEDVRYLHHCGIIEHWLGNDSEVADLFNRLCQEVAVDLQDSYLSQLSHEIHLSYNRKWNVLKATLKHKYFNNPWAYVSFFAAVFLLILTLFQSYFTAYAYFKPPKSS